MSGITANPRPSCPVQKAHGKTLAKFSVVQPVEEENSVGPPTGALGRCIHATRHVPAGACLKDARKVRGEVGRAVWLPRVECGVSVGLVRPRAATNVGVTIGQLSLAAGCRPLQPMSIYERQQPTTSITFACLVLARSTHVPPCRFSTSYEVQPRRAISNMPRTSRLERYGPL